MDFLKRYAGTTFSALVEAEPQDDRIASLEKSVFEKIRQPSDSSEPASDPEMPGDPELEEPVLQPKTPPMAPPWRMPPAEAHEEPENPAQRLLDLEAEVARLRREQGFPPSIPSHPPASHQLQKAMEQLPATAAAGTGASNSSSSDNRPVSMPSAFNYGPDVNDQSVRVFDNGHLPFILL